MTRPFVALSGLALLLTAVPPLLAQDTAPKEGPVAFHDESGARVIDVGLQGREYEEHRKRHEEEERGEDLRLMYVALTRAHRTANVNLPLFCYRRHDTNITNDRSRILSARRQIKKDSIASLAERIGMTWQDLDFSNSATVVTPDLLLRSERRLRASSLRNAPSTVLGRPSSSISSAPRGPRRRCSVPIWRASATTTKQSAITSIQRTTYDAVNQVESVMCATGYRE